jgi:transcriptional regulator with XRE-family HTH domain
MALLHEIGSLIKRRRIELDMTQALLARASGLSRASVNALETGAIKDLSFNRALRVLSVLGLRFEASPPQTPPSASALRTAAQMASVSLRTHLKPAVLRRALTEGYVPDHAIAHIGTLLDEAPPSLLVRLVDEVSKENDLAPAIVWSNMRMLAKGFLSPRGLWQ